ncbi:CRISPR-associated protein Cas4 [Rosettibacter firmus]|uniref:CRISPR-associated protein Cas4 n=1 Tax=Rosettibacter firmus TaxID=3111522 RepID=UPI00336C2A05
MIISGTHINYYNHCKRHLWFFAHHIFMEHTSELVALGKFISESTYQREKHELHLIYGEDEIIIDFYDPKNKRIHEVKKSNKMEETHIWQVKFYIYVLEKMGIKGVTGEIDYPKLRQKIDVILDDNDRKRIEEIKEEIPKIISNDIPPSVINKSYCKNCSYYELCYV